MIKPYLQLNIDIRDVIINPSILEDQFDNNRLVFFRSYKRDCLETYFKKDFIEKLEIFGELLGAFTLVRYSNIPENTIHTDFDYKVSLNAVITEENISDKGTMKWFTLNEGETGPYEMIVAPKGFANFLGNNKSDQTLYEQYKEHQVTLVDQYIIGPKITLVRVDLPHTVERGNFRRLLISFRYKDRDSSWEDAVKFFSELNF